MNGSPAWFRRLKAACPAPYSLQESSRSAFAAALGLVLTVALSAGFWHGTAVSLLVTPVAASMVILFALPHSPLGHPWPLIGGSLVAAVIGLACAAAIPLPLVAGLVALPLSTFVTTRLRAVHPPAGAQALLFAMNGRELLQQGVVMALAPLLVNLLALFLAAMVINNLIQGRRYGFLAAPAAQAEPPSLRRLGIQHEDLQHALTRVDTFLDISEADLVSLFEAATAHAFERSVALTCGEVMSRGVWKVALDASLQETWTLLTSREVKALPVVDRADRVVGVVTRHDFLKQVGEGAVAGLAGRFRALLAARRDSKKWMSVSDIMSDSVFVVREEMPVMELVVRLRHGGKHHVPVVDARHRLVGMITQSDLLAALYQLLAWRGASGLRAEPPGPAGRSPL